MLVRGSAEAYATVTVTGEGEIVKVDADEGGAATVEIKQCFKKNGVIVSECTIVARLRD